MRARKLAANRAHVADTAMRLFDERGYDAVTVDEVAEAADVGRRTVHRYFPHKSDLVFADTEHSVDLISKVVADMPVTGPLSTAVLGAVRGVAESWPRPREETSVFVRVVAGSEELRARELAKRAGMREFLHDALAAKRPDDPPEERHLWSTLAVTLFFLAVDHWLEDGGELIDHIDHVIERAHQGFAGGDRTRFGQDS